MLQLGAAPMTTLSVVADGRTALHAIPLRKRTVLLLLLAEQLLQLEGLNGAHGAVRSLEKVPWYQKKSRMKFKFAGERRENHFPRQR